MKDLWYRLLIFWYRLTGASQVQAEWKARRARAQPGEMAEAAQRKVARTADRRFKCACGQLMVAGDKVCPACGRRQYVPFWLRRWARALGLVVPARSPGSILVGFLMLAGYFVQVRYGAGGIVSPHPGASGMADLYELGAAFKEMTLGPHPWRSVTYVFLHGGLMHIFFNGFVLLQIGPLVEKVFGTARFLFGWVVTGALAVILPAALGFGSQAPTVGASGAVFGLMGMALIFGHRLGTSQGRYLRDVMVKWTLYTTVFGLIIGGVAHGAHFGGLAAGIALGWLLPPPGETPSRHRLTPILGVLSIGVLVAGLAAFGSWFGGDRRPPESISPQARQFVYAMLYHKYGLDEVLGRAAVRVLAEARTLGKQGPTESTVRQLLQKAAEVKRGMDVNQRLLFDQELRNRLGIRMRPKRVDPYNDHR